MDFLVEDDEGSPAGRGWVGYYVRVGDSWTKIDYSRPAEEWMKPLVRGQETNLIEIPADWYLDDLPR